NVPYTVGLVLIGLLLGIVGLAPTFSLRADTILVVFVPILLFEAAINLNLRLLRSAQWPILTLAVVGVGVSMGIVSLVLGVTGTAAPETAIVLSAIVSATDPVAVLSVFKKLGVPDRLAMIVEGESLFNDGTALVVFNIAVVAALSHQFEPAPAILS